MASRRGRGEGSVRRLKSGSWQAILPGRARGGRTKAFPDKASALAWLRTARGGAAPGTLADWLDRWLELHKGRVASRTYKSDRSLVTKHIKPALGSVRLRDLSALRIETYLGSLKGAPGITADLRHKIGKTLRNVLNAAVRPGGLFASSPMAGVKIPPAPKPQTRALSPDELGRVLTAAVALGFGLMFRVWLELGLRPGELLGLRWEDFRDGRVSVVRTIDPETNEEKPPKTPREAPIPLSPDLAAELESVRRPDGLPMFGTRTGAVYWPTNFKLTVWRPVMRKAEVKPGPSGRYICRHTTASLLLSAGVSLLAVSKRLGHATPDFTLRRYAHMLPGDQERATEVIGRLLDGARGAHGAGL